MPLSTRSTAYVGKPQNTIASEIKALKGKKAALIAQEKERQGPLDAERRRIREEYAKRYQQIDSRLQKLQDKLDAEEEANIIVVAPEKPTASTSRDKQGRLRGVPDVPRTRRQKEDQMIADAVWERMRVEKSCDKCVELGQACYRTVVQKGRLPKWPVFIGEVRYGPCRACKLERHGCVKERARGGNQGAAVVPGASAVASGSGKQRADEEMEEDQQGDEVEEAVQRLLAGAKELRRVVDEQCTSYEKVLKGLKRL